MESISNLPPRVCMIRENPNMINLDPSERNCGAVSQSFRYKILISISINVVVEIEYPKKSIPRMSKSHIEETGALVFSARALHIDNGRRNLFEGPIMLID